MKLDLNITAERNDRINWVKTALIQHGFTLLSFEGYTICNNHVSSVRQTSFTWPYSSISFNDVPSVFSSK